MQPLVGVNLFGPLIGTCIYVAKLYCFLFNFFFSFVIFVSMGISHRSCKFKGESRDLMTVYSPKYRDLCIVNLNLGKIYIMMQRLDLRFECHIQNLISTGL